MHSYPSLPICLPVHMNGQASKEEAGAILRRRREALKLTQEQVIDEIGIPTITQLSEYENGKVSVARSKYLPALARVLKLSEDEVRSINPSAVFDAPSKLELSSFTHESGSSQNATHRRDTTPELHILDASLFISVPVFGLAGAGEPIYSEDNQIGEVSMLREKVIAGTHLIKVSGDSMSPTLSDGDHIAIDPRDTDLVDGRIYCLHINGNGYAVKRVRVYENGQKFIVSDNPAYPPMHPDEVIVQGRAVFHHPKGGPL